MIITTEDGKTFDTNTDLTAAERHILQKLFLWESLAAGIEEFRSKKQEALAKGWNQSGPIPESPPLKAIMRHLEKRLMARLAGQKTAA
jgi:hypothetical protein